MTVLARALRTDGAGWLVASLALLASACGEDKKAAPPLEPPELTIEAVRAIGGGTWSPGSDEALELGCAPSPVLVELGPSGVEGRIGDWILRPPEDCSAVRQCGFVSVTVDPSSDDATTVDSAATTVQVDLSPAGKHVIVAEFRADDGSGLGPDAGSVTAEVTLTVAAPSESDCAADSDAGAD